VSRPALLAELRAEGVQPVRPQPRLSSCYRFGQGTFANRVANGYDAPIPVIRSNGAQLVHSA
jgi:hypothetical protein